MSISFKTLIKSLIILAIGFISLLVTLVRMPVSSSFAGGQRIESSSYGLSVYQPSGSTLFTITPLNDYFYDGQAKEHLENKLLQSGNGNLFSEAVLDIENVVFNKDGLLWKTKGLNSKGGSSVSYSVESSNGGIKITRGINLQKVEPTAIGQVFTICSDCMVTDNTNRAYFNGDTVNSDLINIALKANKVPTIIGENQSFPAGITKIIIIGRDGKEKMSMPVAGETIYLQDKWHLLEFKTPVAKAKTENVSQVIYLAN